MSPCSCNPSLPLPPSLFPVVDCCIVFQFAHFRFRSNPPPSNHSQINPRVYWRVSTVECTAAAGGRDSESGEKSEVSGLFGGSRPLSIVMLLSACWFIFGWQRRACSAMQWRQRRRKNRLGWVLRLFDSIVKLSLALQHHSSSSYCCCDGTVLLMMAIFGLRSLAGGF